MAMTFEIVNNIILDALKNITSHARNTQYIVLAQRVLWIASVLGLLQ
jgi:hypothetical protein